MHADKSTHAGAREFAADTAVVAAAQLLLKLRGLVTLPLVVKVLGTAEYGVWMQTLALVDFAGSLVGLNLYHPLVRFLAGNTERGRSVYSTLLTATLAASAAGGILLCVAAEGVSRQLLGEGGHAWIVRVGGLLLVCYNVRQLNLNAYRAAGRLKQRSLFELISTFGELVGISLLLWRGYGLLAVFLFMAIWELAFAAALTAHVSRFVGWGRLEGKILSGALRYALPLLPAGLSIWMLDRGDRLVIGYYLGAKSVGIYSANYAFASLLMLFQTPLQITLLPKVSALWDARRDAALRYVSVSNKLFLTLAVPFVVCVPVVARPVLARLGNDEIGAASGALTLLVSAGVMLWGVSVMQSQIFYGARRTSPVGVVTVAGALLNLLLNVLLVPAWGVGGAAFATLVSYAAACAALYALGRGIARIDFYWSHLAKCAPASLPTWAVLRALNQSARPVALAAAVCAAGATYLASLWLLRAVAPAELGLLKGFLSRRVPEVESAAAAAAAPAEGRQIQEGGGLGHGRHDLRRRDLRARRRRALRARPQPHAPAATHEAQPLAPRRAPRGESSVKTVVTPRVAQTHRFARRARDRK
ncbi:MAG: lipopolysaccharide biosynthesis protein [Pyrinomonadaceae bacterium]